MPSPDLASLFVRHADRLQGVTSWRDVEMLGATNLRRLRELLAEEALDALALGATTDERRAFADAASALAAISATADKPCLPRLRVEAFSVGAAVTVYVGDTPTSRLDGWVEARVIAVDKAHRPDWNDGSANAGYFWQITFAPARPVFDDDDAPLRCSTSEPRLLHTHDFAALLRARDDDPAFFRLFADNATRAWTPLWCIERGLRVENTPPDVRRWFEQRRDLSC